MGWAAAQKSVIDFVAFDRGQEADVFRKFGRASWEGPDGWLWHVRSSKVYPGTRRHPDRDRMTDHYWFGLPRRLVQPNSGLVLLLGDSEHTVITDLEDLGPYWHAISLARDDTYKLHVLFEPPDPQELLLLDHSLVDLADSFVFLGSDDSHLRARHRARPEVRRSTSE